MGKRNRPRRGGPCHFATDTDHAEISTWAHKMRAWMASQLATITVSCWQERNGIDIAPHL